MKLSIETIEFLLLVAAIVAMLARRFRLPYSVGLVVAGIAISLLPGLPQIQFSRELIFSVLLPPLIFEAALYIHWRDLRKDLPVILAMASVGVLLSACVTTLGLRYIVNWEWPSALLFSVLIAATDPVSVIATFKESGARGRLRFLIEAESLFNDGTAAAAFTIAIVFVSSGNITPAEIVRTSLLTIGGGIVCGAAMAAAILLLAGRTNDHLVETMLTTAGAYGSFLLAEHFQFSGVLATLTAGLVLGNVGPLGVLSEKGKDAINSFWEYAAFVANSFVFLLIGMNGTKENILLIWRTALATILLVMVGRAGSGLSDAFAICALIFPGERATPTRSGLGWAARSASSGPRPRTSHHNSAEGRIDHSHFRRSCIFRFCAGTHSGAIIATYGRAASPSRKKLIILCRSCCCRRPGSGKHHRGQITSNVNPKRVSNGGKHSKQFLVL